MKRRDNHYRDITIGIAAASVPFVALGYKYSTHKTLLILVVVVTTLFTAKILIHLFSRRSKLAKGAAIAM